MLERFMLILKKSFCDIDLLPADVFTDCFETLLPYITHIYKDSLATGIFPSDFKDSIVIPPLKKSSLDRNVL